MTISLFNGKRLNEYISHKAKYKPRMFIHITSNHSCAGGLGVCNKTRWKKVKIYRLEYSK